VVINGNIYKSIKDRDGADGPKETKEKKVKKPVPKKDEPGEVPW
jgi:hypothetical protein